jgi:Zn-dependent protease
MKSQIKIGTVFGVELGLHYSWLVIALLITFSLVAQFHAENHDWSQVVVWATAILTGLLFFACLLTHELSHALVARLRGIPIHKVTLFLLGGVAQIEKEASDAKTEFWMAIVGPFTSGVVGLILLALAWATGWVLHTPPATPAVALLVWLGYINLGLAAFNMIPGFPLDGGRVLHAILWWVMHDAERSTRAAARVGQVVAVLFIGFGIIEFFQGAGLGGLWLAFIGWFLLQAAGASYLQVRSRSLLRGLRVRDVMSTDYKTVDPGTSIQDFVHQQLLPTGRRCFLVVSDSQTLGLITPGDVRAIESQAWPYTSVQAAMRPASKIHFVNREMPAIKALEIMGRENINQLPVMSGSRLEGIVTRAHIFQVLRSRAELDAFTTMRPAA